MFEKLFNLNPIFIWFGFLLIMFLVSLLIHYLSWRRIKKSPYLMQLFGKISYDAGLALFISGFVAMMLKENQEVAKSIVIGGFLYYLIGIALKSNVDKFYDDIHEAEIIKKLKEKRKNKDNF